MSNIPTNGGGFTVKEILLDVRDDLKSLTNKIDRIDRQGSIGTKAQLDDHEIRIRDNSDKILSLEDTHITRGEYRDIISQVSDLNLWRAGVVAVSNLKRWQITCLIGSGGFVGGLLGAVIVYFVSRGAK